MFFLTCIVGTPTLCFLKFLLCYAQIPNTKPIMLIVLYLLCSLSLQYFIVEIHDNLLGNLLFMIALFHSMTTHISVLRTDKLLDYTAH